MLEEIRRYRPEHLFVALDGPRPGRPDDRTQCEAVRKVVERIDWNCEVRYLVRETNLGCQQAMVNAIDWLFEHVEEGVILEDDCVPSLAFFRYCDELLDRYRADDRVWMISGTNVLGTWRPTEASYHFGIGMSGSSWGWATWRRAWARNDLRLSGLRSRRRTAEARRTLGRESWRYLRNQLRTAQHGWVDAWDYQWLFSCASYGGVVAYPAVNLVTNIGFDAHGTHTLNPSSSFAALPVGDLETNLRHPSNVTADYEFQRLWLAREIGHLSLKARVALRLPNLVERRLRELRRSHKQRQLGSQ